MSLLVSLIYSKIYISLEVLISTSKKFPCVEIVCNSILRISDMLCNARLSDN